MPTAALVLAVSGLSPAWGASEEEALLAEARALREEALEAVRKVQSRPASAERNAAIADAKSKIRAALDQYALLKDLAPGQAHAAKEEVTELQAGLYWCNKGIVVVLPGPGDAGGSPPALPPREGISREGILADLDRLCALVGEEEEVGALLSGIHRQGAAVAQSLQRVKQAWKQQASGSVSEEAARAHYAWVDRMVDKQETLGRAFDAHISEFRRVRDRVRTARSRLEFHGASALPVLAAWARGREGLPQGMADYLNRQLSAPAFAFTAVPPSWRPEGMPPETEAAATGRLLDDLGRECLRAEGLHRTVASEGAQLSLLKTRIRALEQKKADPASAVDVIQRERHAQKLAEAVRERDARSGSRSRASADLELVRRTLDALLARLDAVPASHVRVVEAWRLRQDVLSAGCEKILEAWTRRALGLPAGGHEAVGAAKVPVDPSVPEPGGTEELEPLPRLPDP